jgi:hypothetical protein
MEKRIKNLARKKRTEVAECAGMLVTRDVLAKSENDMHAVCSFEKKIRCRNQILHTSKLVTTKEPVFSEHYTLGQI